MGRPRKEKRRAQTDNEQQTVQRVVRASGTHVDAVTRTQRRMRDEAVRRGLTRRDAHRVANGIRRRRGR